MGDRKSGQQLAVESLTRFLQWIADRREAKDWDDYWKGAKLSRVDIARECGFGTAALRQNPAMKNKLVALEAELTRPGGPFANSTAQLLRRSATGVQAASDQVLLDRLTAAKASADQRNKQLEEENAAQRGEIAGLRAQLKAYQHLEAHLASTGRLIRP